MAEPCLVMVKTEPTEPCSVLVKTEPDCSYCGCHQSEDNEKHCFCDCCKVLGCWYRPDSALGWYIKIPKRIFDEDGVVSEVVSEDESEDTDEEVRIFLIFYKYFF